MKVQTASHRILIPHSHGCRWIVRPVTGSRSSQGIIIILTPVVAPSCWVVGGEPTPGTPGGEPPPDGGVTVSGGVAVGGAPVGGSVSWAIETVDGSANKAAKINVLVHLSLYITRRTLVIKSRMHPTEPLNGLGKPNYPRIPSVPKGVLIWYTFLSCLPVTNRNAPRVASITTAPAEPEGS